VKQNTLPQTRHTRRSLPPTTIRRHPPTLYEHTPTFSRALRILAPSHVRPPSSPPHFMQPELPTASTPALPVASPEIAVSPTQHGLPDYDTAGVSLPSLSTPSAEDGAGTSAEQLAADAAFAALLQEGERPVRREERRLSPPSPNESVSPKPSTPLRTAKNRIEEYEQAATPPPTKKR